MFLHRVVLGSTVVVAFASSLLQTIVDDADIKTHGATMETVAVCPSTIFNKFHHDGMQKGQRAHATFVFDPPQDGCYLVEELHPLLMCEGSANTKVHVHYCKGLQAVGTVDQAADGGDWAFLGALQFYKGHRGNVTLSNEGTEPGTLTVFDQVRFTWTGESCMEVDAHPRRAEIRMTVDFQNVAWRIPEFKSALKAKLAALAGIPNDSLRLIGLRSGSIIAEFLVLPGLVNGPGLSAGHSPQQNIDHLRDAVAKNTAELCTLTGGPLEGCNVEFKDLGFAVPSITPFEPVPEQHSQSLFESVPEQHTQQQQPETQAHGNLNNVIIDVANVIIVVCAVASTLLLLFALYIARSRMTNKVTSNSSAEINQAYETKVTVAMEEGEAVKEKKHMEEDDNNSTICPSNSELQSDNQSERSLFGC